jgi:DEAD/DEAH box helicase domain-containing protein
LDRPLGDVTLSQALREAYPGAIYYYLARPYRVFRFSYRQATIRVRPERRWTTRPLSQTMVFPRFGLGTLYLLRSQDGFVAEAEMQVSERVVGFSEQRGSVKEEHRYGPQSPYYQRDLNRFFETTGVCWYFPERLLLAEKVASAILRTFCQDFGVQERDLGFGPFHARSSPIAPDRVQGMCVYDATYGSLRLTQRLAEDFGLVVQRTVEQESDDDVRVALRVLVEHVGNLKQEVVTGPVPVPAEDEWVEVIAPGEKGICTSADGPVTVEVTAVLYTPQGVMYRLEHPQSPIFAPTTWLVPLGLVHPMGSETRMARFNPNTGELVLE